MGLFEQVGRLWRRNRSRAELPLAQVTFTILDTELTGLDDRSDDIIAIGAVRMQGGRLAIGGTFHELVRPGAVLDRRSVVIHGITPAQLETMPPIAEVLPRFLVYLADTVLVGHCLGIDLAFLNRDARRLGGSPLGQAAVDTLSVYGWLRHRHPEHPAFQLPIPGLELSSLAGAFGIPVEKAHSALGDAYVTAQLLQRFLPLLREAGVTHLDGLLRIGDPRRQGENLLAPGGQVHF